MNTPIFLSRGIDYLGDLGAKLRDLQGFRTLAHELIQNADDSASATSMVFDVRDDALLVDNDGVFSDCGQIEQPECSWKTDRVREHRCDFHRFRLVASGDKRGEVGTTGAFGIGFIAVYQITDKPGLISAGRHWILHEERTEDQRIEVCPGCPNCFAADLPGTRFVLPWARDSDSALRKALRADGASPDSPRRMAEELEQSLPVAMLFLKRLRAIEIRRNGQSVRRFERLDETGSLILSNGDPANERIWHIVRGDFAEAADTLRRSHVDRIESKRSSAITLAIPATSKDSGLLCACLPTEQDLGLPFHLNADFFTTNDRKAVILAADYQSEWNREALRAAARAIANAVDKLPRLLGAQHFWRLVSRLKEADDRSERLRGEPSLAKFWTEIGSRLSTSDVICTTTGVWTTPASTCLLLQKDEADAIDVLQALGLKIVHEDLRPFQGLLRSEIIGVPVLGVETICRALTRLELNQRTAIAALPSGLDTELGRSRLWTEIAFLLNRQKTTPKAKSEDEARLRQVALAPGRDAALWPCAAIYVADDATIALFECLALGIAFVAEEPTFTPLLYLCRPFDAAAAVEVLENSGASEFEHLWHQRPSLLQDLFHWFENRRPEIEANTELQTRLGNLPLYPSSGRLYPLRELALPGNFTDPLGLTELVDLDAIGGRRDFLQDLGMRELDFLTYATFHLPASLARNHPPAKFRAAALLLADHLGELKDSDTVRLALEDAPIVECADGEFRAAQQCHFDSDAVRQCLGNSAHIAMLAKGHEAAIRDLYGWLGVAHEPRLEDIVSTVQHLSNSEYSPVIAKKIATIVAHLGSWVRDGKDTPQLTSLRNVRWLPASGRNDRWYAPNELHAAYQAYLFESQALFVDIPISVQNASQPFLDFLGVNLTPMPILVVRHLLGCAARQIPVHAEVYRYLNDKVGELAINQLKGQKCLWLGDAYHSPNEVFWGEHPFGRYRCRLGDELRSYRGLLELLEVRATPTWEDALAVLRQIATDFGSQKRRLDDATHAIVAACWREIARGLDLGTAPEEMVAELRSVKCVPAANLILNPPEWMFFENRAGLAAKFDMFLTNNVIPRLVGAGRALDTAGVRPLGVAVQVELLECMDPVGDPEMIERLKSRRNQIRPVQEAHRLGNRTAAILEQLQEINCQSAASIMIRYRLNAFERELHSDPEQATAIYQSDAHTLSFARANNVEPWAAIARELAIALLPEEDPGRFAAGFKEALAAASDDEASTTLDMLGFALLDTSRDEQVAMGGTATTLGTETPIDAGAVPATGTGDVTGGDRQPTPEEAVKGILGEGAPPPTPPVGQGETGTSDAGGRAGIGKSSGSASKKGRPVLRSYVAAPGDPNLEATDDDSDDDDAARSPVDLAGVRRVMEDESNEGRKPKEMPHTHPGYDIESYDPSGRIERYIEVKSLSGAWRNTYAVLSRRQFNKARDLGDSFWLYVVERAERDDFAIHRIQNPVLKANHFMFDDGWRALTEPVSASLQGS